MVIFDNEVSIGTQMLKQSHDQAFLDLIKVDKLNYNLAVNLDPGELYDVTSKLLLKTDETLRAEDVVLLYVFTTDKKGSVEEIRLEDTHAFSAFSYRNDQLEHCYFEKQKHDNFVEIVSLKSTLNGGFSNDDIRMLHFAAIGNNGLPAQSTIYEFNMRNELGHQSIQDVDYSIRKLLLLDNERYWGASTSGLYGEEIQNALMAPQSPDGQNFCGFVNPGPAQSTEPTNPDTGCPVGPNPCYNDPIAGTKKYCTKKDPGGCFAATATLLKATGLFPEVTVDFVKLWNFQDNFLLKYNIGRDYVASFAFLSLFVEPNKDSLTLAADVLPKLYTVIDLIMSERKEDLDSIVINSEFYEVSMRFLSSMRDVEDKDFQNMLDRLEHDLKEFQGLSKKEFIDIFETRPSVSLNKALVKINS